MGAGDLTPEHRSWMPLFCRFYGMTPAEFRELLADDFDLMLGYLKQASQPR